MTRTPCPEPNKEGCPWSSRPGGCFADTDHILPRFLAKEIPTRIGRAIVHDFLDLPDNKQQLCRFEHDQKCVEELASPPELPALDVMRAAVQQQRESRGHGTAA